MKKKIYIWGAGHYIRQVMEEINDIKVNVLAILDSDVKKQGRNLYPLIPVISPQDIIGKDFDYLVISVKRYEKIAAECKKLGIPEEKIVAYWNEGSNKEIFKARAERVEELIKENERFQVRLDSAPYEWGVIQVPQIRNGEELLKKIIKDCSSLCRFGDGEFEMIREKERPWFQKPNRVLSGRLKEILCSEDNSINIAVAQNFIGLDQYKEEAADGIRAYMYGDTRKFILGLLHERRIYYDTYVTRPYIIYKDKKNADKIFPLFKEVWKARDVVLVEGEYARTGVGNDLMGNTHSLKRILCPSQNAWDKYDRIINTVLKTVPRTSLVCISLGPCATVLAYDLAKAGYQALDIGQLDNEYEWYLQGVEERVEIPGKMVAEIRKRQEFEMTDGMDYNKQIIAKLI